MCPLVGGLELFYISTRHIFTTRWFPRTARWLRVIKNMCVNMLKGFVVVFAAMATGHGNLSEKQQASLKLHDVHVGDWFKDHLSAAWSATSGYIESTRLWQGAVGVLTWGSDVGYMSCRRLPYPTALPYITLQCPAIYPDYIVTLRYPVLPCTGPTGLTSQKKNPP